MSHPLETRLRGIARRARWLLVVDGVSRAVALSVSCVALLALVDWVTSIQDQGLVVLFSLTILGIALWSLWRFVGRRLAAPLDLVGLAQRLERRYPTLENRLASAIEFLAHDPCDPYSGSEQLRRVTIVTTEAAVGEVDWTDTLDRRPARRAVLVALAVIAASLGLGAADPAGARLALSRLAQPWSPPAWPQRHHLRVRQPVRVLAAGQPFEATVEDTGARGLPDRVVLLLRESTDDRHTRVLREPMQRVGNVTTFRRDAVTHPFSYRAIGGDDQSMPWIDVTVVEPPALRELTVTLFPPAYTGWPAATSPRDIRALAGTRVALAGRVSKTLRAARVRTESGQTLIATLADDRLGFTLAETASQPLIVNETGSYWFELEDDDALVGGADTRGQIRAVSDLAPSVTLESPESNLFVTSEAAISLVATVKDDLAIRDAALIYRVERAPAASPEAAVAGAEVAAMPPVAEERELLFTGPDAMPGEPPSDDADEGLEAEFRTRRIETAWELASLKLAPGDAISLRIAASDYQPLVGESQPRRVSIITAEELQNRIAQRQGLIINELSRVLELQRESRAQTAGVQHQWSQIGGLRPEDADHLQGAELTQRQVERGLVSPSEGVRALVEGVLEDLRNNRLDNATVERQLTAFLDELDRLEREPLPIITRELTQAAKQAAAIKNAIKRDGQSATDGGTEHATTAPVEDPSRFEASLAEAGARQEEVIASLEARLSELRQWDNYRRFHREVTEVREAQERLSETTARMAEQTLSQDLRDLSPQQRADLERLAQEQHDLARQFERVQERMNQMAGSLREQDPLAADTIEDALDHARRAGASAAMREAARRLGENQVNEAGNQQGTALEQIEEMLDILGGRRENELARLVKKLREAESQLEQLRERQTGLEKKLRDAAAMADEAERRRELERLAQEERQLQQDAARMARRLERLQAEEAAASTASAAANQGQSSQQGEEGDAEGAQQSAAAASHSLDEAQQQLAERRRQAEQDLALEQLAKMEDALAGLARRQEQAIGEARRLAALEAASGKLTRAQSLSVNQLGREQLLLGDETGNLASKLDSAAVFVFALEDAQRNMQRAADLLDHRKTDAPTIAAQSRALDRLLQLLDSLSPDEGADEANAQGDEGGGGEGGAGGQGSGDVSLELAQLKMIKLMQVDLNTRTRTTRESLDNKPRLTAEEQTALSELSGEQGRLADMLRNLVGAAPAETTSPDAELEQELLLPSDEGALPSIDSLEDSRGDEAPSESSSVPEPAPGSGARFAPGHSFSLQASQ